MPAAGLCRASRPVVGAVWLVRKLDEVLSFRVVVGAVCVWRSLSTTTPPSSFLGRGCMPYRGEAEPWGHLSRARRMGAVPLALPFISLLISAHDVVIRVLWQLSNSLLICDLGASSGAAVRARSQAGSAEAPMGPQVSTGGSRLSGGRAPVWRPPGPSRRGAERLSSLSFDHPCTPRWSTSSFPAPCLAAFGSSGFHLCPAGFTWGQAPQLGLRESKHGHHG